MDYTEMAHAEGTPGRFFDAPSTWDELRVRDALLELRAMDAERERLADLASQIVARYAEQQARLRERADMIRQSVQNYLTERNGGQKLAFPDVGTAYLTTRKAKAKVVDAPALEDWLESSGHGGLVVLKEAPLDGTKTLELMLDEFGWRVMPGGEIANPDTGEIVAEVPGIETEPEGKTLAVRSA